MEDVSELTNALLLRYSVLTYVYRLQQLLFIVYLLCVVYAAFQANKVVYI